MPSLRHQRRPRRDERQAGRAESRSSPGRLPRFRRRRREVRANDGMAGGSVRERDERDPLHARQVFLRAHRDGAARLRADPHDGVWHRGPLDRRGQLVRDAARAREGDSGRDGTGGGLRDGGRVPDVRQQRQPRGPARVNGRFHVHEQAAKASDLSQCPPHPIRPDHHLERRLREGHRPHAGWSPEGRAVCARGQSDARPGHARHHGLRCVRGEDSISRRRGWHFAHDDHGPRGPGPDAGRSGHEPREHHGRVLRRERLSHERQCAQSRDPARRDGSPGELPVAHHPRFRLRGELRAADPRPADGRHQPHLPRRA